jgi:hypothetical protein
MKRLFFLLLVSLGILLTGCFAFHNGMITGTATLSSNNFTNVEHDLWGKSMTAIILGIGGHDKETLVSDAKKDLLRKHPLQKNQALANVILNFKTTVQLGIIVTQECFITADIVEFH